MLSPSLMVISPAGLSIEQVGALLTGAPHVAVSMTTGGGAWDNAKKYIEDGQLKDETGNVILKGSPEHAAGVAGDTAGDPLKDTVGPSLHIVAKLIATVTLVLCPLWII